MWILNVLVLVYFLVKFFYFFWKKFEIAKEKKRRFEQVVREDVREVSGSVSSVALKNTRILLSDL